MQKAGLPLSQRRFDAVLAGLCVVLGVGAGSFDVIPTFGLVLSAESANAFLRASYEYGRDVDPLVLRAPVWFRILTGLSLFVYVPFYFAAAWALVRGRDWIQPVAAMVTPLMVTLTGVLVFGVEFFGEPELRTPAPAMFLACNAPYVLVPLALLLRMRRPEPFARRF